MVDRRMTKETFILNGKQAPRDKPPAVVMKLDANGLGVIRSLGRKGVKVAGVDYRDEVADRVFKSRYCSRILRIEDPLVEPGAVLDALMGLADELGGRAVLVPTSDLFVEFVSENRERLRTKYLFSMPAKETIRSILSKESQYRFASEHGVPIPATHFPSSAEEARSIAKEVGYPVYLKPFCSALWARRFHSKGMRANGPQELVEGYERAAGSGMEVLVQEIVPGPATNLITVSGYFRAGEPVATLQHRKLRQYPVDFGIGSMTETVRDEEALRVTLDYCRKLGYEGICEVEWKRDARDGRFKLIEINPRTWTQISQTACAGLDLPYLEYCDLVGLPLPPDNGYAEGVRWWDAMSDYRAFQELRGRKELTWGDWIRSCLGAECNAFYARDDLGPSLQRTGYGLKLFKVLYDAWKLSGKDEHSA